MQQIQKDNKQDTEGFQTNLHELRWTYLNWGNISWIFSSFGRWQIWGMQPFFLGLHAKYKKKLLIKKVMLKNVSSCSKRCLWNFIIAPKSQRKASVLLPKEILYKCKMQTTEKSKLTFQLDIKFMHFQLFSFFLADLQWRHLSANKSTLWWHSGLSWPGEE